MKKWMLIVMVLLLLNLFIGCTSTYEKPRPGLTDETGEIQPVYEHLFLDDDVTEEELKDEQEKKESIEVSIPDYARWPDAFLINELDETVFQMKEPRVIYQQTGRTVTRRNCKINAFFGLAIRDRNGNLVNKVRFSQVQPEIRLHSNGRLGIRIGIEDVGDFPGTLSITVTRDANGMNNPDPRQYVANDLGNLKAQLRRAPEIDLPPPTNINAGNNRVVVETITAVVTWTPQGHPPCSITETLVVRWEFNFPHARFRWWPPTTTRPGRTRTRVSHGTTLKSYTDPEGNTFYSVPVQTFYPIDDPAVCCGRPEPYAVIQFVRHEWNLLESPVKEGGDTWSLDVLNSEVNRANANPQESYDPTFTHNPRGTRPTAPDVVYPGPDPSGEQSINQFDRPGISPELYRRFVNARPGSEFVFHFLSFLVCKLEPSEASNYLTNGLVREVIEYKLRIIFRGPTNEPQVTLTPINHDVKDPCESFSDVIDSFDNIQRRRRQHGSLREGYNHPRGHEVGIPTGN